MLKGPRHTCAYKDGNNHCAVGCFIPHGHAGMKSQKDVGHLLANFPDLEKYMPLEFDAMDKLQYIHDKHKSGQDPRINLIKWVEDNVEDV